MKNPTVTLSPARKVLIEAQRQRDEIAAKLVKKRATQDALYSASRNPQTARSGLAEFDREFAEYSEPCRPLIPMHAGRRFRSMPATHSDPCRPPPG